MKINGIVYEICPGCLDRSGLFDAVRGSYIEVISESKRHSLEYYILDSNGRRLARGCGGLTLSELKAVCSNRQALAINMGNILTKFMSSTISPTQLLNRDEEKPRMVTLRQLSTFAKKHLDKDVKAFVQLGWMDESLEVTSAGSEALEAFLFDLHKVELGKLAAQEIKDLEAENE